MTFNQTHLYLRIHGHFGESTAARDFWSVGFRLANVAGLPAPESGLATFLNDILSPVSAFHTGNPQQVGNAVFLDRMTVARIGLDGKYDPANQQTTELLFPAGQVGGGTTVHPWNTALVTSLRTARVRGRASNGRAYWPSTVTAVTNATGRLPQAFMTSYVGAFKTMLDAINAAGGALTPSVKLHVMSSVESGLSSPVVGIRADSRFDSQERRENDTPPAWTTASIII